MPRPRALEPRDQQLLLRLTESQQKVLNAAAVLHQMTPNQFAYTHLSQYIDRLSQDELVRAQLDLWERVENRDAVVAHLATGSVESSGALSEAVGDDG